MKTIIAGGRDFNDYKLLCEYMEELGAGVTEIVCGMARGADLLGKRWADENNIPVKEFPADWKTHGKAAGHIRNKEMAKYADTLVAFWDGESRGTKNMIERARGCLLDVYIFNYKEEE